MLKRREGKTRDDTTKPEIQSKTREDIATRVDKGKQEMT